METTKMRVIKLMNREWGYQSGWIEEVNVRGKQWKWRVKGGRRRRSGGWAELAIKKICHVFFSFIPCVFSFSTFSFRSPDPNLFFLFLLLPFLPVFCLLLCRVFILLTSSSAPSLTTPFLSPSLLFFFFLLFCIISIRLSPLLPLSVQKVRQCFICSGKTY